MSNENEIYKKFLLKTKVKYFLNVFVNIKYIHIQTIILCFKKYLENIKL